AAIQQEVLVLHVREGFRIEGHADEVEIRIEAVDLNWILHVVTRGTVAVVVGELRARGNRDAGGRRRRGLARAQDVGTRNAVGARVSHRIRVTDLETLQQLRGCRASRRHAILPRPYVDLADHAHLQMLGWGDMAVPEVSSSIWRQVVVGEAAADIDRDGGIRHTVVEGRSVGVTVEVHRVLLEQVGAHDLADVREREEEFVVLVYGHQRRRLVGVHHTDVHDQPRIDMPGQGSGSWLRLRVRDQADRTVEAIRRDVQVGLVYRSTDEYRVDAAGVVDVEFGLHVGTGQTAGYLFEARQWTKDEQVGLRSVAHGRAAVAARDLLALDAAARRIRSCIGGIAWMRGRRRRALHLEALCRHRQRAQNQTCCGYSAAEKTCTKHKASVRNFPRVRCPQPWRGGNLARCAQRLLPEDRLHRQIWLLGSSCCRGAS